MELTGNKILTWLLMVLITGIAWRSFFTFSWLLSFLLLLAALVMIFVFYKNHLVLFVGGLLLSFLLGIYWTHNGLQKIKFAQQKNLEGREISREVRVENEPVKKDGYQQLHVYLKKEEEKILVRAPKEMDLAYGDMLMLSCVLSLVENRDANSGERNFDYRMYLAKENIFYLCQKPKLQLLEKNEGNYIYKNIISLRKKMESVVLRSLPQPEGGLASGILFGGNSLLTKETIGFFSRTGLTHIVAVSGFNVTIIAEYLVLIGIGLGLWRRSALNFALVGILVFVLMVGFPASAVRAGVMGSIVLWAAKNGRLANSYGALLLAAASMLALNPLLLRYDIGFQLSFLATLGILLTSSWWESERLQKYDKFGLVSCALLTFSAQLLVFPVLAYNFQTFSPASFLVNALVLPVVPLGMLLIFLAAAIGSVFAPLAIVFAWLAFAVMHYIIRIVEFFAKLDWASVEIRGLNQTFIVGYYFAVLLGIFLIERLRKMKYAKQS